MLFDLGWSEILLIGVVALVFIGPKDLPKAMRLAGYWVRKARTLSREFQSSIDQMIREAELDDMRQQLKKASEFDLDREFHNTIDPTGSLERKPETALSCRAFRRRRNCRRRGSRTAIAGGVEGHPSGHRGGGSTRAGAQRSGGGRAWIGGARSRQTASSRRRPARNRWPRPHSGRRRDRAAPAVGERDGR